MAKGIKKIITFLMASIIAMSCMIMPVMAETQNIEDYFTDGKISAEHPVITYSGDTTGGQIECFFATPKEMLKLGENYVVIGKETGMSTATISRVSKCLEYGMGGYDIVLERLEKETK